MDILCGGWTCSVPQSSEILMFSQVALLACVRGVVLQRLKKHVEAKGTCQGSEQRDRSLQSLSWREKWQWATTAERKVFRDMLGLTKAEACRLTKGLVWQTPPSSFVTGGHRCSQKSRPRRAATGGKRSSGSAKAKQAKKVPKATPQQCEWPCNLCSAVFVASNKAQLTKKRDNHIVRKHAQVDRSLFTTLRGTMGASHKSKPGKGCRRDRQGRWMWTCNVCSDTSKHASKASLRSLRAHHIKTVHPTVCGSSFTTINGNPGRRTRFDPASCARS